MSRAALDTVDLVAHTALPHGQRFAFAHASSGFNRVTLGQLTKNQFLNLSLH
jgi:hypothetical protein